MIRFENRFDAYAYRIADEYLADSVDALNEGQWVTYDTNGQLVIADGTQKAFMAMGSKRSGRNQVAGVSVKKVSILHGTFRVMTDQFDVSGDYAAAGMTPLKVTTGGIVTPALTPATDIVVGYAAGAPVGGFLKIYSK